MRTIWKYNFEITDRFTLSIPFGATILSVQMQGELPCMWCMIPEETEGPPQERHFRVIGTGNPIMEATHRLQFLGTIQTHKFVWHVFEVLNGV